MHPRIRNLLTTQKSARETQRIKRLSRKKLSPITENSPSINDTWRDVPSKSPKVTAGLRKRKTVRAKNQK
jgi:hypothetical protein